MSLAQGPDVEPPLDPTTGRAGEICEQVARAALREDEAHTMRCFFSTVARALRRPRRSRGPSLDPLSPGTPTPNVDPAANRPHRPQPGQSPNAQLPSDRPHDLEAGAELARELGRHLDRAWSRDGLRLGLGLFSTCVDDTGRRCVATLVAEYLAWREPPDRFFHRCSRLLAHRRASELVRLAIVSACYARLPKPRESELRLLAAVPWRRTPNRRASEGQLAVVGFAGDPPTEILRSHSEIPSLGSDVLLAGLSESEFGWLAEPGPCTVPIVGRPLMWFPSDLDGDLRRLHLLFAAAIA